MRLPIYVVLFAAALIGTAISLRLSTTVSQQTGIGYATALSGGTAALWMLVIVSSFRVVTVSNGTELTYSYPGLAVLGVLGTGVSILILAKGSLALLEAR